jgi:hypothetical protein
MLSDGNEREHSPDASLKGLGEWKGALAPVDGTGRWMIPRFLVPS